MIAQNSILESVGYDVNISTNGEPFYITPVKASKQSLTMIKNYNNIVGLYFLFSKGRIVYVGVSNKNVHGRILDHINSKKFDSYAVMMANYDDGTINDEVLSKCLNSEAKLVKLFKPIYNSLSNIALRKASLKK
jgi:hypothetical protein